ncbi:hypothetical protein LTR32_001581 [Rachicladosporium monterosium]|uniref:FAD-binding domain-containing protein n=1 Tax=Rachicladosporium monterosium TaxID=1507873 RepID=A0ABR0LCS5_9PEZI|nr:hypothetical protein LTR32_001581 [Rachicladosporium monterosium]
MANPQLSSIIIVGAGPSGLLLALLLADLSPRPDITILDAAPTLNEAPRATHYGSPAIQLFRKAGILEEIRRDGYMPEKICWRKLNGERICGYDRSLLHDGGLDGDGLTVYWVGRLCALLEREVKKRTGVSVQWDHKVTGLKSGLDPQDTSASLEVEGPGGKSTTYTADYIVGCDGGNSTVRRLMHGQRNFPGFSWDVPIVATNTMIDLDRFGWEDTQFVIDPVHWFMAARIGAHEDPKQNIWRISYGEKAGLSNEELMERQEMKFEQMLPGHPKPSEYRILNKSPYRVHQRCVERMRVGGSNGGQSKGEQQQQNVQDDQHIPANGFNASEVRAALAREPAPAAYKIAEVTGAANSGGGAWGPKPNHMANNQPFFVQLAKQIATLEGGG